MSNIRPPSHPPSVPTLQPELLTLIFEQLASKHCFGIKNCRLVSRDFYRLSSPFFINRIVIAERLDTLARTKAIIDHPYFSKTITHLIWDASFFEPELARNAETYRKEWFETPGCWTTPDQAKLWRSDHRMLRDLLQYDPRKQNNPGDTPRALPLPGQEFEDDSDGSGDNSDDEDHELARAMSGFAKYHHLYVNQESIRRRRLTWRYMHIAFEKLPKLRHVSFADYRALSFNGESYGELCHRLFGQAMSPRHLSNLIPRSNRHGIPTGVDFGDFVRHLSRINLKLETLSIGRNNFAIPTLHSEFDEQVKRPMCVSVFGKVHSLRAILKSLFSSLTSLHLSVDFSSPFNLQQTSTSANTYLKATTSAMKHLGVASRAIPSHPRDRRNEEDMDSLDELIYGSRDYIEQPSVLSNLFNGLHFEKLRSLELRNWSFTMDEIEAIIFPHAATLESVHLIGCFCHDPYMTTLTRISKTWPKQLSLSGAEIAGLIFQVDQAEDEHLEHPPHECIIEVTDIPCGIANPKLYERGHPFVLCTGGRPEFEAAMLGGSHNKVTRLAPYADVPSCSVEWQNIPTYHTH